MPSVEVNGVSSGPTVGDGPLVAAMNGSLAGLVQPGRILILSLPALEVYAEVGIEGDASTTDVAFIEDGTRLSVVSRTGATTTLHVLDPTGPEKLGGLVLRGSYRLAATIGTSLLVSGPSTQLVDTMKLPLGGLGLPLRAPLGAAARLASSRFLIASGGALEEWDVAIRAPVKRVRIDRPIDPQHVGGSEHRLWMVPKGADKSIDVLSLANRSTRRIELREPIEQILPHPGGDMLVVIGATTGVMYFLDLARDRPPSTLNDETPVSGAAWIGQTKLLVNPRGGKLAVVTIPLFGRPSAPIIEIPAAIDAGLVEPETMTDTPLPVFHSSPPVAAVAEVVEEELAEVPPIARPSMIAPATPELPRSGGWRTELVAWARGVRRAIPEGSPLDQVVERLGLEDMRHALALLYASRLLGNNGVSAAELASVLAWRWDEALGSGALAASGLMRVRRDRWYLADEAVVFLDERSPIRGSSVSGHGTSRSNVAIVADPARRLEEVAHEAAPRIGSLFAPNERGERAPRAFMLEARVRALIPVVPWERFRAHIDWPATSAIVVAHHDAANELGLPIVAVL